MQALSDINGVGRALRLGVLAAVLAFVAGCDRDAAPITECIGDYPAVPRIYDVAPPNCPD